LGEPPRERSSDAGEPAGTAGVPILQVLRGAGLSDALAVVVRWFGGTTLGKGGLARAYAAATRAALEGLATVRKVPTVALALDLPYERVGAVKRLLRPPEVELLAEEYGERARLVLAVERELRADLEAALADLGIFASPVAPAAPESRT
jgi:putative IMPACT (imprinted ancient) family translation regulator